jgi:broad specificity phosphatase PhoE
MARVYIVRHGETTSNKEGIIQGHLDTALNEVLVLSKLHCLISS